MLYNLHLMDINQQPQNKVRSSYFILSNMRHLFVFTLFLYLFISVCKLICNFFCFISKINSIIIIRNCKVMLFNVLSEFNFPINLLFDWN